jgi:SNF2 family DNA or RNA helicase
MEVDGTYMLFYDKFAANTHSNVNPFTKDVTLQHLFESDYVQLEGNDAIKEYNTTFGVVDPIPNDVDQNFYHITLFLVPYGKNNISKYTIVGINIEKLRECITNNKPYPHADFLNCLCRNHLLYLIPLTQEKSPDVAITDIIKNVTAKTGDVVDPIIESPTFLTCQLYPYQKRSIHWLLQREKLLSKVNFNMNQEIGMTNIYYDSWSKKFNMSEDRKNLSFLGGALIDEVGLGKTIQMTTLSLLNPATDTSYIRKDVNRLFSKASLVLCPNQLAGQWKREIEKMVKSEYNVNIVSLLTKVHFDKYTYQDLLDADFVIISYSFLDNQAFLSKWMSQFTSTKNYHKSDPKNFHSIGIKNLLEKLGKELVSSPVSITQKNPNVLLINWHRVIVDEFHEIYTVDKNCHMINLLPLFYGNYKWCVTGTPFNKDSNCLVKMLDFTTGYKNTYADKIFNNQNIFNYMASTFFRRNTKKSVTDEYKLPPIKEKVVWLKFTSTERMMYNAYLADPNNDKFSKFLRQLCCHPKLAEETKEALMNCKTLEDIEKKMLSHYEDGMKIAKNKADYIQYRIKVTERKIKLYNWNQQRRLLEKKDYDVEIVKLDEIKPPENINIGQEFNDLPLDIDGIDDAFFDKPDNKKHNKGPIIIISDDTQDEVMKIIGHEFKKIQTQTLDNLKDALHKLSDRFKETNKDYDGKKTTYEFYHNVIERIRKTVNKDKEILDSDSDSDSDDSSDDEDDEQCAICLSDISEDNIGVTKCGHIYCYECIKSYVSGKHQCPFCRKPVKDNELYLISYEKKKDVQTKEMQDKIALISTVGTKLANLIYYIKTSNKHTIIFSQWDDLLRKVGDVLNDYGIKNVFCRGNVWQRDKAIREFNSKDDIKVIMLSSESAASGTNLTKAGQVVLLDPVYGNYEYRRNTEWQAIGRAHRMGQVQEVDVVRFIVKDTVEEEIYKSNIDEDKKFNQNVKVFESTDDNLTLSKEDLANLNVLATEALKKKTEKATKKTTSSAKKIIKAKVVKDDDSDSDPDSD